MKKLFFVLSCIFVCLAMTGCMNNMSYALPDDQKAADIKELESLGFYDPVYAGTDFQSNQGMEIFEVRAEKDAASTMVLFKNYQGQWCYDPYLEYYAPKDMRVVSGIEPAYYDKIYLLGEYEFASAIAFQVYNPKAFDSSFGSKNQWVEINGHQCLVVFYKPSTESPEFGSWQINSPAIPGSELTCGMLLNDVTRQKFNDLARELYTYNTLNGVDASNDCVGQYGAGSWVLSDFWDFKLVMPTGV